MNRNRIRDRRIDYEVLVDAYTAEERAMAWYYYLDDTLEFPFEAKCIAARSVSPLKKGEKIEVLGLAKEEDCLAEVFVLIKFGGRKLGVPLVQLTPVGAGASTKQGVTDWHYWRASNEIF